MILEHQDPSVERPVQNARFGVESAIGKKVEIDGVSFGMVEIDGDGGELLAGLVDEQFGVAAAERVIG